MTILYDELVSRLRKVRDRLSAATEGRDDAGDAFDAGVEELDTMLAKLGQDLRLTRAQHGALPDLKAWRHEDLDCVVLRHAGVQVYLDLSDAARLLSELSDACHPPGEPGVVPSDIGEYDLLDGNRPPEWIVLGYGDGDRDGKRRLVWQWPVTARPIGLANVVGEVRVSFFSPADMAKLAARNGWRFRPRWKPTPPSETGGVA